jgi:hypothetical protein
MQITDEVDWGLADFAFAGALLGGTGLLLHELAARKAGNIAYGAAATALGDAGGQDRPAQRVDPQPPAAHVCVDGRVTCSSTRAANGMCRERHTCRSSKGQA